MNLLLSYEKGQGNTISVADKNCIFLGTIGFDFFGHVVFQQDCKLLKKEEVNELKIVLNSLKRYFGEF